MTKIQKAFITLIAATLLLFMCVGATVVSYADTAEPPVIELEDNLTDTPENENTPPETDINEEDTEPSIDALAEKFKEYLQVKYGAEYEFYYNQIIDNWGSIEGYLLAFGNKLPEQYQSGWDKFVGWLNEYAPVWATALAIAAITVIAIVGKNKINKFKEWLTALVERLVNKRLSPIENELNLQSNATVAIMHTQKALLGTNDKFTENVKELDEAEKELTDG